YGGARGKGEVQGRRAGRQGEDEDDSHDDGPDPAAATRGENQANAECDQEAGEYGLPLDQEDAALPEEGGHAEPQQQEAQELPVARAPARPARAAAGTRLGYLAPGHGGRVEGVPQGAHRPGDGPASFGR